MKLDLGEYVQRRLYYHCYEAPLARFFERWLRPGDVVADVGAHVGFFTLLAARIVGTAGEVHSFEPVPANFERLRENVALNRFDHVQAERTAVGDREGQIALGIRKEWASGRSTGDYTVGGELGSLLAPVTTLDAYFAGRGQHRLRLVKIDVEGFEPRVISGLTRTFDEAPPEAIVFEHNGAHLLAQGSTLTETFELLTARGYHLRRLGHRGELRSVPPREVLEAAAKRLSRGTNHKSGLRLGIATRNILLNVVGLHETADVA
jgi:FkbM family methyltransferase